MPGKTLGEYFGGFVKQIEERRLRGQPDMPTGFKWIDDITDGIGRGQLWLVAGTPGGGKTTFALNVAKNIADYNKSVLFITLEMTGEQVAGRLFCDYADIGFSGLRIGMYPADYEQKKEAFIKFVSTIDFELVEKGYTFAEIEKVITSYYKDKHPDLIVVDFVQLIDCEQTDQRIAYERYVRKLAELSKINNIGILIVSQFRRPPNSADINRSFELTDLKGTAAFEQLSHVVLIIDRFFKKDIVSGAIDKTHPYFTVRIAKNRHGEMGEREMAFEGAKFRFTEKEAIDYATD